MADAGNRDPRVRHVAAVVGDVHERLVKGGDVDKVDSTSARRALAMHESAIDAGGSVVLPSS